METFEEKTEFEVIKGMKTVQYDLQKARELMALIKVNN